MNWTYKELKVLEDNLNRGIQTIYQKYQAAGFKRNPEAVARRVRRLKFDMNLNTCLRIGYLDIETTGLNAPWGNILTWCIKEKGKKHIDLDYRRQGDIINHKKIVSLVKSAAKKKSFNDKKLMEVLQAHDLMSYEGDKRIIKSLIDALVEYDHVVTYYGGDYRFDLPMIRSRAMKFNIPFPSYGQITQTDLYSVCRCKLRMDRYSLANICEHLGIKGKTPIDKTFWRKGAMGNKKSIQEILDHNKGDVVILEKVDERMKDFYSRMRKSV